MAMEHEDILRLTFSNPRSETVRKGSYGSETVFLVEVDELRGGVRVRGVARSRSGKKWLKPRYGNRGKRACLVDGSDGNLYTLLEPLKTGT